MSPRAQIAASVSLAIAISAVSIHSLLQREPSYDGRTLSQWLEDFDLGAANRCERAADAIDEIGTNAIPRLLSLLGAKDTPLDEAMAEINDTQSIMAIDWDTAFDSHWRALRGFEALGDKAVAAIPTLATALERGENPAFVSFALASIGVEALPSLQSASTNQNHGVRMSSIAALGILGAEARPAIATLIACLTDANATVRRCAADALGRIGSEARDAVPSLEKAREDIDSGVRAAAALALKRIGFP